MRSISIIFLLSLLILSCSDSSTSNQENKSSGNDLIVDQKSETAVTHESTDTPKQTTNDAPSNLEYSQYCNARFEFCVDYPKDILYPQPESESGDGRVFKSKNNETILTVFGRPNTNDLGLEEQYKIDLSNSYEKEGNKNRVITYNMLGNNYYVISGVEEGKVFYQKTMLLSNGSFGYAILKYAEEEKGTYDAVAKRVYSSLKSI